MRELLLSTAETAIAYLADLDQRPVTTDADAAMLRERLGQLPENPSPAKRAIERLVAGVSDGLVASGGPRYFGFVVGGAMPVAIAADWLTAAWDQNAQVFATSPAAAVIEEIVAAWLLDLLRLPSGSSVGLE